MGFPGEFCIAFSNAGSIKEPAKLKKD